MTDWKGLCVELLAAVEHEYGDPPIDRLDLSRRVRAALAHPEPAGLNAAIEQAWKRHSKIPTFNDEEVLSSEGFRAAVAEIFGAAQSQPAEWRLVVDSDGKPIGRLTASGELEPWDQ